MKTTKSLFYQQHTNRKIAMMNFSCVLTLLCLFYASSVFATSVELTITNNSPDGGVFFTPVWVGFHNGSFDSYDGGSASAPELERLAEDGNTGPISTVFDDNDTLVDTGVTQTGTREQSTIGAGPIGPGTTVSETFDIDLSDANRYFSYASMVLPSNDYYIANGNPVAHDLLDLDGALAGAIISFNIGLPDAVNDAGTEVNFEDLGTGTVDESVAGLGLLGPEFVGQSVEDTGTPQNGVNAIVLGDPFTPELLSDFSSLNFNDPSLYPDGIATVTLTVLPDSLPPIPEPSTIALAALGLGAVLGIKRRRNKKVGLPKA